MLMFPGRSNNLSQFVKQGTREDQESFAEVDLLNKDAVVNIRRTISSENRGIDLLTFFNLK